MTMLRLAEVRDWLKTQVESPAWYIGKMDSKKPECIGVYGAEAGTTPRIAIGGLDNTGYAMKGVSLLIHWGRNADKAEIKAQEVYEAMFGRSAEIGGRRIIAFDMRSAEPINVGTDDEGIYEYVVETTIYYER